MLLVLRQLNEYPKALLGHKAIRCILLYVQIIIQHFDEKLKLYLLNFYGFIFIPVQAENMNFCLSFFCLCFLYSLMFLLTLVFFLLRTKYYRFFAGLKSALRIKEVLRSLTQH